MFEQSVSQSQVAGCERARLEEWVPGPSYGIKNTRLIDAAKAIVTGANQQSPRTAKICHTLNRETTLLDIPGDESTQVRQCSTNTFCQNCTNSPGPPGALPSHHYEARNTSLTNRPIPWSEISLPCWIYMTSMGAGGLMWLALM